MLHEYEREPGHPQRVEIANGGSNGRVVNGRNGDLNGHRVSHHIVLNPSSSTPPKDEGRLQGGPSGLGQEMQRIYIEQCCQMANFAA